MNEILESPPCSFPILPRAAELVKKGLDPNKANKSGDTPLHVAAKAGNVAVCSALVDCGSDPLARNNKNRTPRGQIKVGRSMQQWLSCRFLYRRREEPASSHINQAAESMLIACEKSVSPAVVV